MHFTPAEAIRLIDEGDVDAAVIHPPEWDPLGSPTLQAVKDNPGRLAILGAHDFFSSNARIGAPGFPSPPAVRSPWGKPTFAQPPGKGQMRYQRLLVAVPTESRSYK